MMWHTKEKMLTTRLSFGLIASQLSFIGLIASGPRTDAMWKHYRCTWFRPLLAILIIIISYSGTIGETVVSIITTQRVKEASQQDPSLANADYSHLIDLIFRFRYSFRRLSFCVTISVCWLKRNAVLKALDSIKLSTSRCLASQTGLASRVRTIQTIGWLVSVLMVAISWLSKLLVTFDIIVFPTQGSIEIMPFWRGYWNIMSGLASTPSEYAYGLIAALTVAVVVSLTAQIDLLLQQAKKLHGDLRNGHPVMLPKSVASMRMAYSNIKKEIAAVEDGFGWIIVVLMFADVAQIFVFMPLFLVQGIVPAVTTYFLHLVIYIVLPAIQLSVVLMTTAKNLEKSRAFCDELRQVLIFLNKAELSEIDGSCSDSGKDSLASLYGVSLRRTSQSVANVDSPGVITLPRPIQTYIASLLRTCEKYPMGVEVGFLGLIEHSTITEVAVVFGGYLCFLIERGERSSRASQTLSRLFDS